MSLRSKFFALTYDRQIAKAEQGGLHAMRERLLAAASGDVVEIGGGTGLNLPCYGPQLRTLTITEPEPPMLRRLESQGLLTSEWREEDKRNKRFYRLSADGLVVISQLAAEWRAINSSLNTLL